MTATSRFWDKTADKYARLPITHEDDYETKLRVTQGYLRPDMRLLEFGCGTGGTAIAHAPHVAHILAIDFSERMLEKARQRAHEAEVTNITFERADITTLPLPDQPYDMVLGLSILHLLKDPDAVIARVYRMLRPGGYFVSSTACLGDTMGYFKVLAPIGRALGLLPILKVMSTDEVIAKIKRPGFEIAHRWKPGPDRALFVVARKPG
ncbi:class I SAM-dependent methyltransferase [Pelagibacterium flavum]|uniref:Class I SAM-dependent methyltransferase n=1 Tax=Pelagibacterium flavum TaxID=2984530 RepID=A0ABY6IP85_9HYPH|nr:class I SAM-dependent methyltransferase [Pelagibacterium sp. YIM 151497]MAN77146.1 SAM-dependent methyltransferase [Hyphomicrobiales bacterium]UYQ71259.1 class I SAM-dependent methyltransferase [Pelagibacterium sp. YIM 151497]|tara:strand:+ start:414 stop:1037 length:624 start_codon:yes stop_codon:yes gene_type:complete|eukprot:jgi/Tetstr1/450379/TSEL_037415.t1